MFLDTDLLVVGTGAKGTAIAIKAHVLNSLGLGPITVTMVEASGPAAAWMDGDGNSSSRELLAISPSKDAGYPYESSLSFGEAGAAVLASSRGSTISVTDSRGSAGAGTV